MDKLSSLPTETRNPKSEHIDLLSPSEIVRLMNGEDRAVAPAVEAALPAVARIAEAAARSFAAGGRLIYMGAGTSGRLGVLDAAECRPTFGVPVGAPDGTVIGLIAGGERAMFEAVEGAEDSPALGESDLRRLNLTDRDTVVGIAASGRTPYVVGGLTYARSVGAVTGAVSCAKDAKISALADFAAEAVTGPEVLTGSTRLKAGTAQKMILNMISTAAFVLSGKTYGNLMIDVQATNEKLVDRARRIVMTAVGCGEEEAALLCEKSGRSPKTAVVMGLCHVDRSAAEILLSASDGHVRGAVRAHESANCAPCAAEEGTEKTDFLIGIDAGGTKTRALAYRADDFAPIPESESFSGPGNLTYDPAGAVQAIAEAAGSCAEAAAKVAGGACLHLSVGAAGFSSAVRADGTLYTLEKALDKIADCPKTFVSDAALALHADFASGETGMIVISGTGSAAFLQAGDNVLRAGGWGNLLGDGGSGWSVSRAAVRELLKMLDAGQGDEARGFFDRWKAAHEAGPASGKPFFESCSVGDLISFVTHRPKKDLSRLACGLVSLYEEGDPLCAALIRDGLTVLAQDCTRLLDRVQALLPAPIPVVLTGGFFESNPSVRALFREILRDDPRVSEWREDPRDPTCAVVRHYGECLSKEKQS
jgi:N-acetylmuramic acid 6-phosphate etherase